MKSLKSTRLSSTRLQNAETEVLVQLDSPIAISIKDIIPMGKKISYVEDTQGSEVSEKFKNDMIWQEILKNTK
jgi:hypothetical protein